MDRQTVTFGVERETKNTVRPVFGILYEERWPLGEPARQRFTAVIEGAGE